MAQTYTSSPVLSKIKIGNQTYYLKDADVRAIIDTLGTAAFLNADSNITDEATGVASTAAIKSYVDQAVAVGIEIVVDTKAQDKDEPATAASANTMGKLYFVALDDTAAGTYTEFITLDKGSSADPRYVWEKIGTTEADLSDYLTKADATLTYVAKKDAGALAYADSASDSYTPAGTITLNASTAATLATLTKANYTPEGTISKPDVTVTATTTTISVNKTAGTVTTGTAASFTEGAFTPNVPTVIDVSKFDGGSKAADTFTAGTLPSKVADSFTAPSLTAATTATFATAGIVANVGTGDDAETLIFGDATTASAVTDRGTFTAGSFTEGAFDAGSLPSFTEGAFTAAKLNTGFYTAGTAASKAADTFDGGSATEVTLPTFENATVVTGATAALAATPTFTGTTATDALVTSVSYDKTSVTGATFTGTAATITVTPDTTE